MSQKPSGGENEHQLPQDGDDQTQNAVAQSLTNGGGDDAEGGGGTDLAGADDNDFVAVHSDHGDVLS